jgi:hypothetical protein
MTSSTALGSTALLVTTASMISAATSTALRSARPPLRHPIGVRRADQIGVGHGDLLGGGRRPLTPMPRVERTT